jgi:hypothetical protein
MEEMKRERAMANALAGVSLALRAAAFFRYRFDSDEPQHLHVAWGWTAGLLQYRDVFDNHAPLFHILSAPILSLVGERADAVLWMRGPMLLLFTFVLWGTYTLGRRLYSPRVGLWSAVLLSLLPPFFLKSLEYRTDNLWTALVVAVFVLISSGPLTAARVFVAGLLLGTALATSMKTTLVVFTLLAAAAITAPLARAARVAIPALLGMTVVPAIVAAYFVARGAWPNLVYCVFTFNQLLTERIPPAQLWVPRILWVPLMVIIIVEARRHRAVEPWRRFFAVAAAVFFVTLGGFWIFISPRDYLPIRPLLVIFAVAAVVRQIEQPLPVLTGAGIVFVVLLFAFTHGFANGARKEITMMRQVLRLTRPGEPVMDFKGETVFRPRPYYYIIEHIARMLMEEHLLPDTIPEDVVREQCHVAQADGSFWPPRARAFLRENFVDVGRLRASGQWLRPDGTFSIAIPGDYVILSDGGEERGALDGTPYAGRRALAPGTHRFAGAPRRIAVLWAPAYERGFSPFRLRDRKF